MRGMLFIVILMSLASPALAGEKGGSVCLGPNLSVVLHDRDHVTISIGDVEGVSFSKDNSPKIVAEGLDLGRSHPVTIYYDGEPVERMTLDFSKLKGKMALIWRAKGGYRMAAADKCVWPMK